LIFILCTMDRDGIKRARERTYTYIHAYISGGVGEAARTE